MVGDIYYWDKGANELSRAVDGKQLLQQAEMLAEIEKEAGVWKPKQYSREVRNFLRSHSTLITSSINSLLGDWGDTVNTYEYRGDFMALGVSTRGFFSYSVSYHPAISEKEGKIYITISNLKQNSKTVNTTVLSLRAPKGDMND